MAMVPLSAALNNNELLPVGDSLEVVDIQQLKESGQEIISIVLLE